MLAGRGANAARAGGGPPLTDLTDRPLERLHGEIRRRTNAIGAFPDRASALRLVTAVALQVTAIWSYRRYLDMNQLDTKQQIGNAA